VQPTIVEAISFMAWKASLLRCPYWRLLNFLLQDEAYELGQQWANLYDSHSPSHKLICDTFQRSLLVNVVHNDYKRADAIFEPFFKAAEEYAAKHSANGY
jgi:methylenetetrahydrofolate reductase (NADPH)